MKLSIIVPSYNIEKFLPHCLNSVVSQLNEDVEVIVVDDGSIDSTPSICDEYANKYKNVIAVHKQNGGLSDARNAGMKIANGDYLCFLDGDDFVSPNVIDKMLDSISNGDDAIMYPFFKIDKDKEDLIADASCFNVDKIKHDIVNKFRGVELWPAWKIIVKKSFVESNNLQFPYGRIHEDVYWTSMVLLTAKKFSYSPLGWYHYVNYREGSITSSIKIKNLKAMFDNFYDIENLKVDFDCRELQKAILARVSEGCFAMLRCYLGDENKKSIKKLVRKNKQCFSKSKKKSHIFFHRCLVLNTSFAFFVYKKQMAKDVAK